MGFCWDLENEPLLPATVHLGPSVGIGPGADAGAGKKVIEIRRKMLALPERGSYYRTHLAPEGHPRTRAPLL